MIEPEIKKELIAKTNAMLQAFVLVELVKISHGKYPPTAMMASAKKKGAEIVEMIVTTSEAGSVLAGMVGKKISND